jgi:hypothetical protein
MKEYTWLIFAFFGLKIPLILLGIFIYKMLKAVDADWEDGGYGWDGDEGGGGGGGGSPLPDTPKPGSGPARRRPPARRKHVRTVARPHIAGVPVRRPAPLRTRVKTRTPARTRP